MERILPNPTVASAKYGARYFHTFGERPLAGDIMIHIHVDCELDCYQSVRFALDTKSNPEIDPSMVPAVRP